MDGLAYFAIVGMSDTSGSDIEPLDMEILVCLPFSELVSVNPEYALGSLFDTEFCRREAGTALLDREIL